jgi:thiamine biosynthesis lipoprotein
VRFETPIPWIDCGGIGKGFAADQALGTLMACGIDVALVELGGDIALGGPPPGTDGWSIDRVIGDTAVKSASLRLSWCGVATSGAAEQHVSTGEQFASHVIDPRTGVWVGRHADITVIAPTASQADALASAGCVIGPAALRQRLIDQPGIRVY